MLKIGVTGSIGSGKSIVCKVFEHLGIIPEGRPKEIEV